MAQKLLKWTDCRSNTRKNLQRFCLFVYKINRCCHIQADWLKYFPIENQRTFPLSEPHILILHSIVEIHFPVFCRIEATTWKCRDKKKNKSIFVVVAAAVVYITLICWYGTIGKFHRGCLCCARAYVYVCASKWNFIVCTTFRLQNYFRQSILHALFFCSMPRLVLFSIKNLFWVLYKHNAET